MRLAWSDGESDSGGGEIATGEARGAGRLFVLLGSLVLRFFGSSEGCGVRVGAPPPAESKPCFFEKLRTPMSVTLPRRSRDHPMTSAARLSHVSATSGRRQAVISPT